MKKFMLSLFCILTLCACTNNTDNNANSKTNASTTEGKPQDSSTANTPLSTLDDFMTYLNDQGVEYADEQPISDMNITAHEGRSFNVNGSTGYIYRIDSTDDTMKKLLASAQENGELQATQNGVQKSYTAHVNGDYLLLYDKDANLDSLVKVFPSFNQNAPQTSNTTNPSASNPVPNEE